MGKNFYHACGVYREMSSDEQIEEADYEIIEQDRDGICGAECADGSKCQNPKGECPIDSHGDQDIREEKKKQYLKAVKGGLSLQQAAQKINRDKTTVLRWRKNDQEFGRKVRELKEAQRVERVQKVADMAYDEIMEGNASVREMLYWLEKRGDDMGWGDKQQLEVTGDGGGPVEVQRSKQEQLQELVEEYPELQDALADIAEKSAEQALESDMEDDD